MHEEQGVPNPLSSWELGMVKRGIQRRIGKSPKQKLAITPEILHSIHRALDLKLGMHMAFWAACLVGFFGFLRKSTLLPKSGTAKEIAKALIIKDISYTDSSILQLNIRHTKTIQFGQRQLSIPLAQAIGSPLCPVNAVTDLLANLKDTNLAPNQPLFSYVDNQGKISYFTHSSFVKMLKITLKDGGFNPTDFSGHSFRRGGCTYSFQLGVSPTLIKLRGDWKSNAFERYITIHKDQHVDFAKALSLSVM